ncbi:hypothetical protein V5H41_29315, partial [Salmonella enterica]
AEGQYCTAEVAIALLDLAGDTEAATSLGEHFSRFKTRYLAEGQYCTAEVAIALLDLAGDTEAATSLGEHFSR